MPDETKAITPAEARANQITACLTDKQLQAVPNEVVSEAVWIWLGRPEGCVTANVLRTIIAHATANLAAQVERLRALLRDVAASGVEFEDPRVDYCTVQVDTDTWREVRTFAEEAGR